MSVANLLPIRGREAFEGLLRPSTTGKIDSAMLHGSSDLFNSLHSLYTRHWIEVKTDQSPLFLNFTDATPSG